MRIDQILPNFSYGDAIGNHTLALREVFRKWGMTSEIFAQLTHPKLARQARFYEEYSAIDSRDNILVYHFSVGSMLTGFFSHLKCRKLMIYHNITPGHFFEKVNRRAQWECEQGRRELSILAGQIDLALGDSEYNRQELEEMGFTPTGVLPIFLPFDDYREDPDRKVTKYLSDGRRNILHVGRFVPNKKVEDLIKTFFFYRRLQPASRLILVGTDVNMENYSEALRKLTADLKLEGVLFAGHVSFPELLAYYKAADLYLVMSEHEGFCVPLLEAMIMGVPIIAYRSTAIPDTLEEGGILFDEKEYHVVAELMHRVLEDDRLKASLVEAGRNRLAHFSPRNREDILASHLSALGVRKEASR